MKILSYNVNGIRAAMSKDLVSWLDIEKPDVVCLQEIKAMEEQIDVQSLKDLGYHCYWFSAQKKGYSGVGILSKKEPISVKYGCDKEEYDNEGRVLQANFKEFSVISVYVPSASNIERLEFKMDFCHYFLDYINEVRQEFPNLIICGDYNICHEAIDIHDPVRNAKVSGFLPEEREWLTNFFDKCELIDSFRIFNNDPHYYSWWSYRANSRANNKGWRIDYTSVSNSLKDKISDGFILSDAKHSDHCPVGIIINI